MQNVQQTMAHARAIAAAAQATEEVTKVEKRKPGRPKKAEQAMELRRDPYETAPSMKPVQSAMDAALVMKPVHNNADPAFALYVNCLPDRPWMSLSRYLEPILADIRTETGLDHYALIDYKAGGVLGSKLYTALQANPPTGNIVVDTRTREGADCLPTLERFAGSVTRGF
jgi:hypothetical protein